jgi:hypothetical protein
MKGEIKWQNGEHIIPVQSELLLVEYSKNASNR